MEFFCKTDAKEFKAQVTGKFGKLMDKEGLNLEDVKVKKEYIQICQVSLETKTNFKYSELAALLNVSFSLLNWRLD